MSLRLYRFGTASTLDEDTSHSANQQTNEKSTHTHNNNCNGKQMDSKWGKEKKIGSPRNVVGR